MDSGKQSRMDRLFNRHGDGCAVCVAADHGYMSDVTANVTNLRPITSAVIRGGVDGILLSPGQARRLAHLFQGRDGPALILRADWMNAPRLGTTNVANSTPQRRLIHRKMVTAEQALALGASAITIYLFMGYNDAMESNGIEVCTRFVNECRKVGLPCIIEPLAYGGQVTGSNIVDLLTLGARIAVEIGADALKIPYTGDVESFRHLCEVAEVPVLVLGGARSDYERDALELFAEALEAGGKGCLMGRNVTKSPDPQRMIEQLTGIAHKGWSVDEALRGEIWDYVKLKAHPADCTGCNLCVVACVASHDNGD
jgi:class I fructose-bisphosphate aldolase